MSEHIHRRQRAAGLWDEVPVLAYKQEGAAPFSDVTRQVLYEHAALGCQLRYFEVAPGGHSTLERHEHVHAVMVLKGRGRALVGGQVFAVELHDLVEVPALAWHQFRADTDEPLGFLCMVNAVRDRPQLPDAETMGELCADPAVAAFIRT